MKNFIKIFLLGAFALSACTEIQIPDVPVASMVMNEDELNLSKGKTFQLSVTMLPEDATDKALVWKSTKESVATVTPEGLVTALGYGTAYIVATNTASSLTAACMVTVEMKGPYQIIISDADGTEISKAVFGYPGMTLGLVASSTDIDEHTYTWTSSAAEYITAENGLLTWKNVFASEAPSGYLLYSEAQIVVMAEDGTAASFTAVNNVLASFGLDGVSRQAGAAVRMDPSQSRAVQIYAKTTDNTVVLSSDLYTLKSTDSSVLEVAKSSNGWSISSKAKNGSADLILEIAGREFTLAAITVEEHVEEPDKEFGSGNTEKFPVDDDIDWEVPIEQQDNQTT